EGAGSGESVRDDGVTRSTIDLGGVRDGSPASYGETRPVRGSVGESRRGKDAGSGQLDMFASPVVGTVPLARKAANLLQSARLVTTGGFRSGVETISDWTDVAHIIAPLRKSPQEQFLAVVAD